MEFRDGLTQDSASGIEISASRSGLESSIRAASVARLPVLPQHLGYHCKETRKETSPALGASELSPQISHNHYARKAAFPIMRAICHSFSKIPNVHF